MPRKNRQRWRIAVWAIALSLFLLFIVLPVGASLLFRYANDLPKDWMPWLDVVESLLSALMFTFCVVWVFFVGGTFASFLNVVAWRVPRGKSILGSSHCPYCNVKLTFRDNVPVFGWVKNYGRCSNCRLPISSRYVWVEIALGLIFLLVVSMLLLSGGATLPNWDSGPSRLFSRLLLDPKTDLIGILVSHLTAILGIFTFVLIELERKNIPISICFVTMIFLIGITQIIPNTLLLEVGFPFFDSGIGNSHLSTLVRVLAGAMVGLVVGLSLDRTVGDDGALRLMFGMSIVGAVCGWQSVLVVACIWAVLKFATPANKQDTEASESVVENLLWSPNAKLLFAFILHLATWRWFDLLR